MKLKSVSIRDFKRFTNLTVQGIPETGRLIMLVGPNGSGKSSFFDALHTWYGWRSRKHPTWDQDYHGKVGTHIGDDSNTSIPEVELHGSPPDNLKKYLYIRTAYRNDPEFQIVQLQAQGDPLNFVEVGRMIENDAAVRRNYERLTSQGIIDLYGGGNTTFDEYIEKTILGIQEPVSKLFPELFLTDLGSPLENGTFYFSKGVSQGFDFKNLSGGEKAAFDLILDLVVTRRAYDDTLFCIDEPESHLHARLQANLLSVLYELIPESSQLMLATHSIGMMRRARDIEAKSPGSVVFLDFGGRNFDEPQVIEPVVPDRVFWQSVYEVALDDLAALIAPERVVICEGEPQPRASQNHSHDARCYERIFQAEFPETRFVPGGNALEVSGDRRGIELGVLTEGTEVLRLIDRDARSGAEVTDLREGGVRVLSRRNLESYLFDNAVLQALAEDQGREDAIAELLAEKEDILAARPDDASDDLKPASGQIYLACKRRLALAAPGNDAKTFMRDTLAPLIKPGMDVYEGLKQDIFGQDAPTDEN